MLEPQTRATLTDQLAPPPGFALSRAVGTTFTLDLSTALSVPLSFASRRVSADDDSLGILDAVRRAADRIDIFAQAGEISMGSPSDLVAFLEPMVHPVTAPRGLFHPKVWFLEYRSGDTLRYRFLCLSRNLTDDRSWDVIVRLDGLPSESPDTATRNAPLVDLLRTLPSLTTHPVPIARQRQIAAFADRVSAVEWERPASVQDVQFHVLGLGNPALPNFRGAQALIISPFASDGGLDLLSAQVRGRTHVLSRAETLDRLSPASVDADDVTTYILDDAADLPDEESAAGARDRLTGLHAKAVIVDHGKSARAFLGSANATDAAWRANVEVMVEVTGSRRQLGVDATLAALAKLIEEYVTPGGEEEPSDEREARRLESLVRRLAQTRLTVRILRDSEFGLSLWGSPETVEEIEYLRQNGVTVRWHLLTRADLGSTLIAAQEADAVPIEGVPLTDLTPFVVLVARDSHDNERRTIVVAELLDDVANRKDAIIARQLTDRASFLRLLTLMLEISGFQLPVGTQGRAGLPFYANGTGLDGAGLFESLVRAVGVRHTGIEDVRRVIDFVRQHGDDRELLPDGFEELWENVWRAQQRLTRRAK